MTVNNRNYAIDVFRAIAIILITGYHVLPFINNPTKPVYIFDFYAPFIKGDVGVALFVFISGYITHAFSSNLSPVEFIKKRFWRVAFPYYVALLVWNIFMSTAVLTGGTHNLTDNVSHLLFIHNLHPQTFHSISGLFWYVGLQMQLYVLYLFLRKSIGKHGFMTGFMAFAVCLAANIVPAILIPDSAWLPVITHSVFSYGFLFLLGVFGQEYIGQIMPYLKKWYIFYFLIFLSALWLSVKGYISGYVELEKIMAGFLLGLIMLGMPRIDAKSLILRPFILIGTAAYSIYLYNYIFWVFSPRLLAVRGLVLYSMITICFGIVAYYLIEEPFLKRKSVLKN
jgi:peptidoglycan/LPS O-acetylase OafA/YrhL